MPTTKRTEDSFTNNKSIFESRYYVDVKRLLSIYGQWPFQSPLERSIRTFFFIIFAGSLLIPMSLALLQSWENIDAFMECISCGITGFGAGVKVTNMIINTAPLQKLLDKTSENWESSRKCSTDFNILQEFGEKGRSYAISYFMLINGILTAWVGVAGSGVVMDYIVPLNESRHKMVFQVDYGLDQDEYYTLMFIHATIICFSGMQMFVAHDALYMVLSQHACAMIAVLRYHLENITTEREKSHKLFTADQQDEIYYEQIVLCMKRHKNIIQYVQLMESTCEWPLVVGIFLNVLVMSCTGARTVAQGTAKGDVIKFAFFNFAQVGHLLCITLPGHWILEASTLIRDSAYNCKWHVMSTRSKRLIIIFLRRSIEPCTITAGKIYVMSMENFCSVLQTSMSYVTMLTSMQ